MRSQRSVIRGAMKLGGLVVGAWLLTLVASTDALACRQCENWCTCIDACQDQYWQCRQQYEGAVCIPLLDYCQRRCTCAAPKVDPILVDLEVIPGGVRWYVKQEQPLVAVCETPEMPSSEDENCPS